MYLFLAFAWPMSGLLLLLALQRKVAGNEIVSRRQIELV